MFNILQFHIFSSLFKNTKIVVFVMLSLLLSACGSGGEGSEPTTSSSASSNVNDDTEEVPEAITAVVISSQPITLTVNEGSEAVFTVVATGGGELSYQWRKGEDNISGANSASLTLSNVELSSVGEYSVVVTNSVGAVSSLLALLSVDALSGGEGSEPTTSSSESSNANDDTVEANEAIAAVVISSQPITLTVNEGSDAVFTVVATGGGELSYQWRKGEDSISGANSASLTLSNVELSSVDEYSVVVTNSVGAVSSLSALLSVNPLLTSVELNWDIPVSREDGSELELYEINGYIVKYGTNSDSLDSLVNIEGYSDTSVLIEELSPGTYYFAIATIDSDGVQGAYSTQLEQIVL